MKIKLGATVQYVANVSSGTRAGDGKVHAIDVTKTGERIVIVDYDNRRFVSVRPSQVVAVRAKAK